MLKDLLFANISLLVAPGKKIYRTSFEGYKILYKKRLKSFLSRIDRLRDICKVKFVHDDFKRAR